MKMWHINLHAHVHMRMHPTHKQLYAWRPSVLFVLPALSAVRPDSPAKGAGDARMYSDGQRCMFHRLLDCSPF